MLQDSQDWGRGGGNVEEGLVRKVDMEEEVVVEGKSGLSWQAIYKSTILIMN